MIATFLLLCLPLPAAASAPPAPGGVPFSIDDEVPDKREDVKEWTSTLKAHAKQRGEEDAEAIALIDTLIQEWEGLGPKDRALVVKTLDGCLSEKRRETDDGVPNHQLHTAAAVALGEMGGEDAAEVLDDWIGHKRLKSDLALQRTLILSLGRTTEEKGLKTLLGLLKHPEPALQAAGAEALGEYEVAELDVRKEIFQDILKQLVPLYNDVRSDTDGDTEKRDRLDTISGPMISTLRQLSGHQERDPNEFQRWWNKNKKADWDEL